MSKEDELFKDTKLNEENKAPEEDVNTPDITSAEWSDYVMTLFDESELVQGDGKDMPLVAGLRRVAELVMGRIVKSGPTQVFPATNVDHPGRATVVFEVEFEDGSSYSEVADSYLDNTNDDFCIFPVAIASTRAEARALRKALRLKCVSAEEITNKDPKEVVRSSVKLNESKQDNDGEFKGDKLASDAQVRLIGYLSDKSGVDKTKLLEEVIGVKDDNSLTMADASSAIDQLNAYQQDDSKIPKSVKK